MRVSMTPFVALGLLLVSQTLAAPAAPKKAGAPAAPAAAVAVPQAPAVADTAEPLLKFVDAPTELILNDRKHPVKVQYSGLGGVAKVSQ